MNTDDIGEILAQWPFDANRIQARMSRARDGRLVIQLRVDVGLLQMERDGRPDGMKPDGFQSLLHKYRTLVERTGSGGETAEDWSLPPEDFPEIDRELVQYHHRRLALMSLGEYARAARDAEHSIEILRIIQQYARDSDYVAAHVASIPPVLMERARARALLSLKRGKPRAAVVHVEEGIRLIQEHVRVAATEAGDRTVKELAFLRRWGGPHRGAPTPPPPPPPPASHPSEKKHPPHHHLHRTTAAAPP